MPGETHRADREKGQTIVTILTTRHGVRVTIIDRFGIPVPPAVAATELRQQEEYHRWRQELPGHTQLMAVAGELASLAEEASHGR